MIIADERLANARGHTYRFDGCARCSHHFIFQARPDRYNEFDD
jgi:hypothetical protein